MRPRVALIGLAALASGCGRVGFDESRLGDALTDASADATFATGPFSSPQPIAELTADTEDDPCLSSDQLEIYFNSGRNGGLDIWRATRATLDAPWDPPTVVAELSTPSEDSTPELSRDGLTLWLSSDRPGGAGNNDIYVATRPDRASPWQIPVREPVLSSPERDTSLRVVHGGLVAYFGSARDPAGGHYDIWRSERVAIDAPWLAPTKVAELSTATYDSDVWVDESDTVFVFASERSGNRELWQALRTSRAAPWSAPTLLSELASPGTDADPWLSPDGHTLYFASDRGGASLALYTATR